MKALNTILKIAAALAALAGTLYVVATYGDKIVAWAKKLWAQMPHEVELSVKVEAPEEAPEEIAEEAAPEEAAEEAPAEEEPAVQVAENEPVADETDFAE